MVVLPVGGSGEQSKFGKLAGCLEIGDDGDGLRTDDQGAQGQARVANKEWWSEALGRWPGRENQENGGSPVAGPDIRRAGNPVAKFFMLMEPHLDYDRQNDCVAVKEENH